MSTLSRYGLMMPSRLVSTMVLITTTTARRYGRKKPAMRRRVRERCSGDRRWSVGSSVLPIWRDPRIPLPPLTVR